MLPTKFQFIWPRGFRGEDLKKSTNQKQELPVVAMFVNGSGQNVQSLERTAHRCFLPSFGSFGQMVSEKNFKNQPIRNKCRLWRSCLSTDRDEMTNRYRGPSIDASYQVSVHLAKRFQRKRFKKSTNQKQELPVAAMFVNGSGQNVQSLERTAHRCFLPCFGSFGQTVSEEKNLKNQPIRNKNCLWWPCLLMDRDKMSNVYRGPSIDAPYQVSVQLVEGFRRRRLECEKLTDDGRQVMAKAHIAFGKVS
jgi:hypothetical protein